MPEISQELEDLAKRHFPHAVAGELKKFIEEAGKTAEGLVISRRLESVLQNVNTVQAEKIQGLESVVQKYESLEKWQEDLENKEIELEGKERNFKVALLEAKLTQVENRSDVVVDLVKLVFGHPNVTVQTDRTGSVPVVTEYSAGGGGSSVMNHTTDSKETVRTTEGKTSYPPV